MGQEGGGAGAGSWASLHCLPAVMNPPSNIRANSLLAILHSLLRWVGGWGIGRGGIPQAGRMRQERMEEGNCWKPSTGHRLRAEVAASPGVAQGACRCAPITGRPPQEKEGRFPVPS